MDAQTKKCPMCAEQIPADSLLCPYCGTRFGEEVQAAPLLAEPVPTPPLSPAPLPAPVSAKKSHAGLWIAGALVMVIFCAVIGAVLWSQRLSLPALSGLFATPTLTSTPTLPPTLTPTTTPSITPSPTPMGTPLPDWVINFSEPILLAIQDRPPDFQDDFHDQSGGWFLYYCSDWRMQFVAGELIMTNCEARNERLKFTDYVLEVDARFVSYDQADGRWGVSWGSNNNISINNWGEISWLLNWGPKGINSGKAHPGAASNHILLIVKGTEYTVYVNDQPLSYIVTDATRVDDNDISLFVPNLDQTHYEIVVAFDNFKIWDISDLP